MSRIDDAIRAADELQAERDEIAAGEPIGVVIPKPTKADLAEAADTVDSIRAGTHQKIRSGRAHVGDPATTHPDSLAGPVSTIPTFEEHATPTR